ncbi:MAG: FAD-dependent oxidoreductase [Bulleidia sp.]|nr:FAD-dependent oxidoreductase [Erysipelotrichaceae bacterium]MDY2780394.1 FAD-dependent oxidoreductase [Bulleidia sp.]
MKRLLVAILAFSLCACNSSTGGSSATSTSDSSTETSAKYTPGTYVGKAQGIRSEVEVSVTFDENSITNIEVTSHGETKNIADAAIEKVPAEILEAQSLDVDVVTSVTFTSRAIINAVEEAAKQATDDISSLTAKRTVEKENDETIDTDVVVVGMGLAGATAAVSAVDEGVKVVAIEKAGAAGGSSKYSGGFITAVGTKQAQEEGVTITADDYFASYNAQEDLSEKKDETDRDAMKAMIERSASDIEFLDNHNDPITGPDGFGSDFKVWHYPADRTSAFDGEAAGADHIVQLMEWLNKQDNFSIYYNTPATKILTDENGKVSGVECTRNDGSTLTVNAKSVVLATGGYAASKEMMERFCPDFPQEWVLPYTTSSMYNTGDGITMAEALNADIYEDGWWMDLAIGVDVGGYSTYFPDTLNGLINYANYFVTDGTGKRILNVNSLYGPRSIVFAKAMEETGKIYSIFTKEGFENGIQFIEDNNRVDNKNVYKADTLEELAEMTGMDANTFVEQVNRYNEMCEKGVDEDLGQTTLIPIGEGPYYAVDIKTITMGTIGGLKTDDDKHVLDKEGNAIDGLYAAGELINGKYFNQVYTSGCAQLLSLDSGIIAGRNAATSAK